MRTSNDRWTSPEERYAVTMSLKLCRNFLDDFDAVGAVAVALLPALRMALARASIHRGARTLLVVAQSGADGGLGLAGAGGADRTEPRRRWRMGLHHATRP